MQSTLEYAAPSIPVASVSARVRERLKRAGARFHANDNIAAFLHDGEMQELAAEVAEKVRGVLDSLVIDVDADHNTRATAERVARMFVNEVFSGRFAPAPAVTEFPNAAQLDELLIVGPLSVRSACSHHLCPVIGKVWLGVMPKKDSSLIGLSKYGRLVHWVMSRPQIQEEAVAQLADLLEERLNPAGLAIVLESDHLCMQWRGVKEPEAKMVNSVMRGSFLADAALRREFLALLPCRK